MMIWINSKMDYLKISLKSPCHAKHLWFILLFLSKHVMVLLFPSVFVICASPCVHVHLSVKFVLLHVRDFSSEGACVSACQHSSCEGMSRAKQNIQGTFHTLCHLLSCPELRPIKSALPKGEGRHAFVSTQLNEKTEWSFVCFARSLALVGVWFTVA